MKFIYLLVLTSLQLVASPATKFDIEKQQERQLLRRIITEELSMNVDKMKSIITSHDIEFEENGNQINFEVNSYKVIIIYDTNADRMRIVVPIVRVKDVTPDHIKQAMKANFHTALDAKYAISNEVIWSVFVHPLSDLSEKLFISAIDQTIVAAATFGKEFSSGSMSFPTINNSKVEKLDNKTRGK